MAFFPKLHTDDEDLEFLRGLIAKAEVWIAAEDGTVRGLACLDGDWLAQLYIHPDHQGRGIGTALLGHVKRERPGGFQLWTFQANAGARRFLRAPWLHGGGVHRRQPERGATAGCKVCVAAQLSANRLNSAITDFTAAFTIFSPASTLACDGSEPMRPSGKRRR